MCACVCVCLKSNTWNNTNNSLKDGNNEVQFYLYKNSFLKQSFIICVSLFERFCNSAEMEDTAEKVKQTFE